METLELSLADYFHSISLVMVGHHWPQINRIVGLLSSQELMGGEVQHCKDHVSLYLFGPDTSCH